MNVSDRKVRYRFDPEADAAYIYLTEIRDGEVDDTYVCEGLPENISSDINLDFDKDGKLLGIEIIGTKVLPEKFITGNYEDDSISG